jgi:hypothetical protein
MARMTKDAKVLVRLKKAPYPNWPEFEYFGVKLDGIWKVSPKIRSLEDLKFLNYTFLVPENLVSRVRFCMTPEVREYEIL